MATRGTSTNIIVGAAQLFTASKVLTDGEIPAFVGDEFYADTLESYTPTGSNASFRNVGYTMNGLELVFQPDFGEVQVDQVLDVAKLYKQGMQVNLNTAFAEATLENLLFSLAGQDEDLTSTTVSADGQQTLSLSAGDIGECPVERGLIAVGPGTGDCDPADPVERVYMAYRALSIENVTVSAKRDEPTMFEVSFRLLPSDTTAGSYGKIVDRAKSYQTVAP